MWYNGRMDKAPTQKARVSVGVTPSDSPIYARFGQTIDVRIEKGVGPAILLRVEENGKSGGIVMAMPSGRTLVITWTGDGGPDEMPLVSDGGQRHRSGFKANGGWDVSTFDRLLPVGVNLEAPASHEEGG